MESLLKGDIVMEKIEPKRDENTSNIEVKEEIKEETKGG